MAYNTKNLNVASLDFTDIVSSLTSFLEKQPNLTNVDFRNPASAANMLINILSTATAYNGAYAYFGYNESFKISAQNLESFSGMASNESILLPFTQSASTTAVISATSTVEAFTPFTATAADGTKILFFNATEIQVGTASYTLYSGTKQVTFTDYNFDNQYIKLPLNIDPRTILFEVTDIGNGTTKTWTRVDRGEEATLSSTGIPGNYYTVINGADGYIVTNNFVNTNEIDLGYRVEVSAVQTNGSIGNNATVNPLSSTTFITLPTPSGGYDTISVEKARSTVLFNGNGRRRWVTPNDVKQYIISLGYTDDITTITVQNGTNPGSIKVYVDEGLTPAQETQLLASLTEAGPAGISITYSL